MIVSIALSQLCDPSVICFLSRLGSELQTQLSYMGGRPHLSSIILHCDRAMCANNLARVVS